jgi:uncharacterized protein YlxW (UPF0749 family)
LYRLALFNLEKKENGKMEKARLKRLAEIGAELLTLQNELNRLSSSIKTTQEFLAIQKDIRIEIGAVFISIEEQRRAGNE